MTTRQDLHIRQGETFSWVYTTNPVIDLTGYSARMSIKASFEGSNEAYLSTGSDANGGTLTLGGGAGTVTIDMTATQTAALAGDLSFALFSEPTQKAERFVTFIYDLELIDGSDSVTRELQGRVIVEREVTG